MHSLIRSLIRWVCGADPGGSVHRLTAGAGAVFTRAIEHLFEYGLFPMMLEVLL